MSTVLQDMAENMVERGAAEAGSPRAKAPFLMATIRAAARMLAESVGFDPVARFLAPLAREYASRANALGTQGGRNRR